MPSPSELAASYNFSEAFFRADNELWNLFTRAKNGNWNATKFQGEFMKTGWYRSREASIRQWTDLTTRDPAEARAKVESRKLDLSDQFTQLGVNIDDATLTNLATQSLQYSWSQNQVDNVLSSYVNISGGTGGAAAAMETKIKDLGFQYGVTITNDQLQDWIPGLVSKKYSEDNIRDFITDNARSKYSGLTKQLDAGRTTRDIASQHIAAFSQLMEVDAGNVDLDDPIIAAAIQGTVNPQTQQTETQNVSQMQRAIMKDQRWLYTGNARQKMTDLGQGILKDMGLYS